VLLIICILIVLINIHIENPASTLLSSLVGSCIHSIFGCLSLSGKAQIPAIAAVIAPICNAAWRVQALKIGRREPDRALAAVAYKEGVAWHTIRKRPTDVSP